MLSVLRQIFRRLSMSAGRAQCSHLHDAKRFQALLMRERARVDRRGGEFCVVTFKCAAENSAEKANKKLAQILQVRLRVTDDAGVMRDGQLAVLLCDTSPAGAEIVAKDVCAKFGDDPLRPQFSIQHYINDRPLQMGPGPTNGSNGAESLDNRPNGQDRSSSPDRVNGQNGHNGHALDESNTDHDYAHAALAVGRSSPAIRLRRANRSWSSRFNESDANGDGAAAATLEMSSDGWPRPAKVTSLADVFMKPMPLWKRTIDIVGASIGLLCLTPLFAFVAFRIRRSSPGPIFFTQPRSGKGGRPFAMYKFRSMIENAEAVKGELLELNEQDGPAFKMENDPRVTPFGRFIRKTSIDELPQLWNVLKGEMSLVGPRPLPLDETERSLQWHRRRLDVTPGLTCIWQVRGRSRVEFNEWVRMDIEYIEARTLWSDLKLLFLTVPAVLLRRGAQ